MGGETNTTNDRQFAIVMIRLEALENAIRGRDWDDVEFQYDRVLRSVQKAQRNGKVVRDGWSQRNEDGEEAESESD